MSFDIHLQCFRDGEPEEKPLAFFAQAFAAITDQSDPGFWTMPDSHAEIYIGEKDTDENSMTSGFMVARPPGKHPFWDVLLDIMKQTPSLLFLARHDRGGGG
jgi:hypothetical protein